jgi:dTDP-4-amino-4,6-dideoxygalactose transaminase
MTAEKIPLVDLGARLRSVDGPVRQAMDRVLASGRFILGPEVEALESEIATFCGVGHGVGLSSGSDALLATMMALGLGPGDEVITTPMSFFASVGAILRLGAKPVFADIDPRTFNLRADLAAEKITEATKAIEVVHLFGQCAETAPLVEAASWVGASVIEDAAQSIGATRGGLAAGSLGRVGCFSFFPTKNLGCLGDGGMAVTNDAELADRMRLLRGHGARPKYHHIVVGANLRLDALQAAILRAMLPSLEGWSEARRSNADRYDAMLADSGLVDRGVVTPPWRDPTCSHVFHHYVIRAKDRDELRGHLSEQGVSTEVYYPLPLHLQPCLADLGYREGDLPEAELAAREVLALPVYPELKIEQQERVVEAIGMFYGS